MEPPRFDGLTDAEVAERIERGESNRVARHTSRSVGHIVRANVVTRFNAILGGLLAVILVVGPIQDALFGIVLVANTLIGIVQEVRAKRTLDRLALVVAPRARVVRGGLPREVPADDVVVDDVLDLGPGDQLVVDAVAVRSDGLEVDESLVTGEAEPVLKDAGDGLVSGSFVVAGSARAATRRVGGSTYAAGLSAEARRFSLARSELRAGIDRILTFVTWVIVPVGVLLVWRQVTGDEGLAEALRGSVAGIGSMVPEGLVLLTSVAFAVAVLRLARRRVVVQELPAVETLARVDVVCIDKTGTLTEGSMRLHDVVTVDPSLPARDALGALAGADPRPNATMRAIATACPPPAGWQAKVVVPFSSARKWSAVDFGEHGAWYLGAPEILLPSVEPDVLADRVAVDAGAGRRLLLVAAGPPVTSTDGERSVPTGLRPAAVAILEDRLRADAAEIVAWLTSQDVAVKVLSGDHPATVAAVAARLGIPGADAPLDARTLQGLPTEQLAAAVEGHAVLGRVVPEQKRDVVAALQSTGHVVAMTGDGVNDVLALKQADLGVAMGSGSAATRAVAQLVLLDDDFGALPAVVAEGRRVIANVERVANLFVTKTVYAALLALCVGVVGLTFPFYPRHLTVVSALTIGVPAFFLALAPASRRPAGPFLGPVLRFAVPAGALAATLTFTAYAIAVLAPHTSAAQDRTAATIVLFCVGLAVLVALTRPWTLLRAALVIAMGATFVALLAIPATRDLLAFELPPSGVLVPVLALGLAAGPLLALVERRAPAGSRNSGV